MAYFINVLYYTVFILIKNKQMGIIPNHIVVSKKRLETSVSSENNIRFQHLFQLLFSS